MSGVSKATSLKISRFVPGVDLARKNLDLKITVNLDSAIKRTILWNQMARH